jgi:hypothetical protein
VLARRRVATIHNTVFVVLVHKIARDLPQIFHASRRSVRVGDVGMVQFVHHPEVWRYRAALTRVAAEHGVTLGAKEHELKLAALYERFARYAEERVSCERARKRLLPPPSRAGLITARDGACEVLCSEDERAAHDLREAADLI